MCVRVRARGEQIEVVVTQFARWLGHYTDLSDIEHWRVRTINLRAFIPLCARLDIRWYDLDPGFAKCDGRSQQHV